jgi:tetratricopeptide (TPR) repeat protein
MKQIILFITILSSVLTFSQTEDDQLALDYFKRGEFEKALISYQKLYEGNPGNFSIFLQLVKTHQQLKQFDQAQQLIFTKHKNSNNPSILIILGYNYQLKENTEIANQYYNDALQAIEENPLYVYNVARQFEEYSLLDQAITTYKRGMELNPSQNFNIQLARIYGEQGNIEGLFSSYMEYIVQKPEFIDSAKREFSEFISENKDNENNLILKKLLLKKIQSQPDISWYDLLSWLFVQEKDYEKSFTQEKALYKRNPESLDRIVELALTANDEKQAEVATDIFNYVLENTQNISTQLLAHQYLLDIEAKNSNKTDDIDKKYQALFETYGTFEQTFGLQIAYADFLAFHHNQPQKANEFLKESLKLNISPFQEATAKLKLGDILVLQEQFNEALIYYTQIQANLKNSTISQEARFKVAKTSYYKGDFEWAESQLKVLKASTSQLIANDALDLKLLISDNKYDDSLQVALKLYAKADLMAFQNKNDEAIVLLDKILAEHNGESITDEALFKQAKLFEKKKLYDKAIKNYELIIANYADDIFADDAYYYLAELYNNHLGEPEKAKELYEKIIFNHQDSIFFVEARKEFRMLRGDTIN